MNDTTMGVIPEKQVLADLKEQQETAEEAADSLSNLELSKKITVALHLAYPRHQWLVYVDQKAGHYYIRNTNLSGKWGMVLRPSILHDINKMAIHMGGELLERYNISRTRTGPEQALEYSRKRPAHA